MECQIVLVRHGKTKGYSSDLGLAEVGREQARARGAALAADIRAGMTIRCLHARTARARETAHVLCDALEAALPATIRERVEIDRPAPEAMFDNIGFCSDGELVETTDHQARRSALLPRSGGAPLPAWAMDGDRFWASDGATPHPTTFWLTNPALTLEPPAIVAARVWSGIRRAVKGTPSSLFVIVCTHSACLRALTAATFGHDAGEPSYLEPVRVHASPQAGTASLEYRGARAEVELPDVVPPWVNPAWLCRR